MSYFRSFNHMNRAFLFFGERIPRTFNDSNLKSAYSFSNDDSKPYYKARLILAIAHEKIAKKGKE